MKNGLTIILTNTDLTEGAEKRYETFKVNGMEDTNSLTIIGPTAEAVGERVAKWRRELKSNGGSLRAQLRDTGTWKLTHCAEWTSTTDVWDEREGWEFEG